jgi:O-antigen ligase/polysaccharide polymerase Wzy-like membrane protein
MSEFLEVLGGLAAVAAAATALYTSNPRVRAAAMVAAMALAAALIAGQGWDELQPLRDHPPVFAASILGAVALLALLAWAMLRWPMLLPLLIVAAMPFRIRLHVGGGDAVNLLVPLYGVIGAGVLASVVRAARHPAAIRPLPRPLVLAMILVIGLYAAQASYSDDVAFAARNIGFFLVPFAVLASLLAECRWDRRLLFGAFAVILAEGLILALVGIGQHVTSDVFWNPKLVMSNDFHFYFRVNSLFWDPNIYGRYLNLTILAALAVLLWTREERRALEMVTAIAVVFVGLLFAFSQTSFIALFVGLAVLGALRWSVRWAVIATPLAVAAIAAGVLFLAGGSDQSARAVTEGHTSLISGGVDLAKERPILGHGSASFPKAFAAAEDVRAGETTISHDEPVTVAAEQGIVGIAAYLVLLAAALWTLFSGMRRLAPGFGAPFRELEAGDRSELVPARVALAAVFCALLVHTIGYAAYLIDPLTWALLAVGGALAAEVGAGGWPTRSPEAQSE